MRLHQHMIVSAGISAGIYAASRSAVLTLVSFVAGFIIDLDHWVDYWRAYPGSMNVRHFFSACEGYQLKSLVLFMHSWELLGMFVAASYLTRSTILLGITIGCIQHLLLDQAANYTHPYSYFFFYRLRHRFRSETVFREPPSLRPCEEPRGND